MTYVPRTVIDPAADLPRVDALLQSSGATTRLGPVLDLFRAAAPGGPVYAALWESADGTLAAAIAFSSISLHVGCTVDPAALESPLEDVVVEWIVAHARRAAAALGATVYLSARVDKDERGLAAMLERHGLKRHVWESLRMARSLADPISDVLLPAGFALLVVTDDRYLQPFCRVYSAAFGWGHEPQHVEERRHEWHSPGHLPPLVAIAPDGTFAAFCSCTVSVERNAQHGVREGWVGEIGTHPDHRRRGLAGALLTAGLRQLRGAGLDTAVLSTGAQRDNPARALYDSFGFRPAVRETRIRYELAVAPPGG
jgi:GNAT superfamily N-acetyltransferase